MAEYYAQAHPSLEIRKSLIPGAGRGVFTTTPLPEGTHLGYYFGRIHWRMPKHDARNFDYFLGIRHRPPYVPKWKWRLLRTNTTSIDGANILALLNCCRGHHENQNCVFTGQGRCVTTVDVPAGTELLTDYGPQYWIVQGKEYYFPPIPTNSSHDASSASDPHGMPSGRGGGRAV